MHNKFTYIFTFITDFKKEKILKLNKNIGIILRNYDKNFKKNKILEIKNFCKQNGRKFYLANNLKLAIKLRADGIYIPAFNKKKMFLNLENRNIKIIGSAHNQKEIHPVLKLNQHYELFFH